jgi:hypothetical protein
MAQSTVSLIALGLFNRRLSGRRKTVYTVKMVSYFPVPKQYVTKQTLLGRE